MSTNILPTPSRPRNQSLDEFCSEQIKSAPPNLAWVLALKPLGVSISSLRHACQVAAREGDREKDEWASLILAESRRTRPQLRVIAGGGAPTDRPHCGTMRLVAGSA